MPKFLSSRRKSPVVFDPTRDNGPNYAVDVTGGGRSSDQPQDVGEQVSRNCDLRHLEGDVAAADDLRADLDQLPPQARKRPISDRLGRRQCAQEEGIKLKANGVGGERAAREPRPSDRALASLDDVDGCAGRPAGGMR